MSSAPATHGPDAHDAHVFTGEPTDVLPADEPRTPGWLPLLGIALFTAAAVTFLAGREPAPATAGAKAAAPATAAEAPRPPVQPPAAPAATMARPARPAQTGEPAVTPRPVTPQQREVLRKALDEAKPKAAAPRH